MTLVVDRLLAERVHEGNPVRVVMAGCGFMGRGLVNHIVYSVPCVAMAAIAVRSPDKAFKALVDADVHDAAGGAGPIAGWRSTRPDRERVGR